MAVSEESKKRWSTQEWKDLTRIQNRFFSNQDIMTITYFMNNDQFMDHVVRYRGYEGEELAKLVQLGKDASWQHGASLGTLDNLGILGN